MRDVDVTPEPEDCPCGAWACWGAMNKMRANLRLEPLQLEDLPSAAATTALSEATTAPCIQWPTPATALTSPVAKSVACLGSPVALSPRMMKAETAQKRVDKRKRFLKVSSSTEEHAAHTKKHRPGAEAEEEMIDAIVECSLADEQ